VTVQGRTKKPTSQTLQREVEVRAYLKGLRNHTQNLLRIGGVCAVGFTMSRGNEISEGWGSAQGHRHVVAVQVLLEPAKAVGFLAARSTGGTVGVLPRPLRCD